MQTHQTNEAPARETREAIAPDTSESDFHRLLEQDRKEREFRNALEPNTFADVQSFAEQLHKGGMYPDADGVVPSVASFTMRIMMGRQLGISATLALQHLHDFRGKVLMSAILQRALVKRHPLCVKAEFVETDHTHAIYLVQRKGHPERRVEFTMEDARRAGLVKKDGAYEKWPRRMMQARASSEAIALEFEDATMGLGVQEEMYEVRDVERDAPPPKVMPARDWAKETSELQAKIVELIKAGDEKKARDLYNAFVAGGPPADCENALKDSYNRTRAGMKGKDKPPAKAPAGQQSLAGQDEYLPPGKRGDNYSGPLDPPGR